MAWLVHEVLFATALASPGYQGYQHFLLQLLFVLALPCWIFWYSQVRQPGTEGFMCFTSDHAEDFGQQLVGKIYKFMY